MNRNYGITAAVLALGLGLAWAQDTSVPASATKDSSLYPNDFGPAEIDVSEYPKNIREGYKLMAFKCAACHTVARPINAQFLELTEAEEQQAKKDDPEIFKDDKITKVEEGLWKRYVKRMMGKPGCPVKADDGKKIWEFLVFDSKVRKMGAKGKEFRAARAKLLEDFKEKHKDVYDALYVKK